jgi:hypothetical protein
VARRKAQTFGSASVAGNGGRLSARQSRRLGESAGPAFAIGVPPAILCAVSSFPSILAPEAASGEAIAGVAWTLRSSASSWQGFIVSPGGAPAAARVPGSEPSPRGAAPHPACTTPRDSAPQRMRRAEFMGGAGRGDNAVTGEDLLPRSLAPFHPLCGKDSDVALASIAKARMRLDFAQGERREAL